MITMRDLALEQHLLEITQRRRHRLHALTELDKMVLDELLTQASREQPRQKVPHIPPIKADLRNIVVSEQPAQMVSNMLVGDSPTRRRLQITLCAPKIVGEPIDCRLFTQPLRR